nr:ICE1 [Arum korolkowii]
MLSKVNGVVWMEEGGVGGGEEDEDAVSWTRGHEGGGGGGGGGGLELGEGKDELGLATFRSMLEDDWYLAGTSGQGGHGGGHALAHQGFDALQVLHHYQQQQQHHHHHQPHHDFKDVGFSANPSQAAETMLLQADSSSSCSPSSVFSLDPSQPFFPQKAVLSSLLNAVCSNPFDAAAFDLGCDASGFLVGASQMSNSPVLLNRGGGGGGCVDGNGAAVGGVLGFGGMPPCGPMGAPDLSPTDQFQSTRLMPLPESTGGAACSFSPTLGFGVFDGSPFLNRSKVLRPLEIFPPVGTQPTLFQKRAAALRQNSALGSPGAMSLSDKVGSLGGFLGQESTGAGSHGSGAIMEEHEKRKRGDEEEDMDETSIDGSGLNYDSDEVVAEVAKFEDSMRAGGGANTSNANRTVTGGGDQKGKKKGLPAKNLMAERRRRKKLNDRLYMLRSVVPKITKVSNKTPPHQNLLFIPICVSFCLSSRSSTHTYLALAWPVFSSGSSCTCSELNLPANETKIILVKPNLMDRASILGDAIEYLKELLQRINVMDRASILGDAIEYLKELLQRINDLHNELESTPSGSSLPSTAAATTPNFHPLTPTPPTLPCRVKEELCPSSLPSPNSQLPRLTVGARQGTRAKFLLDTAGESGRCGCQRVEVWGSGGGGAGE